MSKLSRYWKTVLVVLGGIVVVGNQLVASAKDAYGDGEWTYSDTVTVAMLALTAILVYAKANTPPAGELADPDISETDR